MLHGWEGSASDWEQQASRFQAAGYHCIVVPFPGWELPEPPESWGVSEYAEYVERFLKEKYPNSRWVLSGHSFGGRIALSISARLPERVKALILTSPAGLQIPHQGVRKFKIAVSRGLRRAFFPTSYKAPSIITSLATAVLGSSHYRNASPLMQGVMKKVLSTTQIEHMKNVRCPTLLVWGDRDRSVPLSVGKRMRMIIPSSHLVTISGAGHHVHISHPLEWSEHVRYFLEDNH